MSTPAIARIQNTLRRAVLVAFATACGVAATDCPAAGTGATSVAPDQQLRLFLEKETSGMAGRVEVSIGSPDARLHLAACGKMEPFVPTGARLWGRTMLGVRCVEGATWQVFLPAQVRVYAPAPVATHPLNAGDSVTGADMRMEEIELTRYQPGAIADPTRLGEMQLSRPISTGQPLLRNQFHARQVIVQGDPVKLVYSGPGFSVSTEGRALSSATEGQNVRVVTDSGRTLSGTARAGRVVELRI